MQEVSEKCFKHRAEQSLGISGVIEIFNVNIYIELDSNSAKMQKRAFGTMVEFVLKDGRKEKRTVQGVDIATGNQISVMALIEGLEILTKSCNVTVHMENRYVSESIRLGRVKQWAKQGWKTVKGQPIANSEQWQQLYKLLQKHQVKMADMVQHPYREELEKIYSKLLAESNRWQQQEIKQ